MGTRPVPHLIISCPARMKYKWKNQQAEGKTNTGRYVQHGCHILFAGWLLEWFGNIPSWKTADQESVLSAKRNCELLGAGTQINNLHSYPGSTI